MYCNKCKTKNLDESTFCFQCGNKLQSSTQQYEYQRNSSDNQTTTESNNISNRLDECNQITCDGTSNRFAYAFNIFMNEFRTPILYAFSSIGINSRGFSYSLDEDGNQVIMTSKVNAGETDLVQNAYDSDNSYLGSASLNKWCERMIETKIEVVDNKNQVFSIEENIQGVFRKILKFISSLVPPYGIGNYFDYRTGDMIIKKKGVVIGRIQSKRGSTKNTYIIQDCNNLRKYIDIRLLILAMIVKISNTK